MNDFKIESCNKANIKTIVDGINNYNLEKVPVVSEIWTRLEFVITDDDEIEIGGILAGINYWNGLEIKILWIKDTHRKRGLGRLLLKHTETIAKEKGAYIAMVDTFDFQAERFYLHNNYSIVGELNDFPKGHRRIYFSKTLHE